jgi:hypothetical protein
MSRKLIAVGLLAFLAVAAHSSARESFDTKLTINYHFDDGTLEFVWDGKVKSDKHGCVANRKVFLRNQNDNGPLGSVHAAANGKYEIRMDADGLGGKYYTQVKRIEPGGYSCKGAQSPKLGLNN